MLELYNKEIDFLITQANVLSESFFGTKFSSNYLNVNDYVNKMTDNMCLGEKLETLYLNEQSGIFGIFVSRSKNLFPINTKYCVVNGKCYVITRGKLGVGPFWKILEVESGRCVVCDDQYEIITLTDQSLSDSGLFHDPSDRMGMIRYFAGL